LVARRTLSQNDKGAGWTPAPLSFREIAVRQTLLPTMIPVDRLSPSQNMPTTIAVRKAKEMMAASTLSLFLSSIVCLLLPEGTGSLAPTVRRHSAADYVSLAGMPSKISRLTRFNLLQCREFPRSRTRMLNNNSIILKEGTGNLMKNYSINQTFM
jgi:hypothetical protein